MSILHGRDLLSSKYVTAIITDGAKRAFFVPIKYHIGEYFIADINNQKYVFSMNGDKFTYQDTLVKSFQFIIYNTANYKPVSPKNMALLELFTINDDLPRMNLNLFSVLKLVGQKQKKGVPYKIKDLRDWVEKQRKNPKVKDNEFLEQSETMLQYLDHLNIEEICSPTRQITEFIEDDLIATDPKFPGSVIDAVLAAELENKRINNIPIKSKTAWIKVMAVVMLIGLIGAVLYIAYDGGAFDSLIDPISSIGDIDFNIGGAGTISGSSILERYPTPEAMKCAIERGELQLGSVPAEFKGLVSSAECVEGVPQDGGVP